MITQDVVTVAQAAIVTSYAGGAALTLAIAGAMVEALWPGVQNRTGARVWEALVWVASMALRLLHLIACGPVILAYRLAVTYLHTYPADKGSGRHYRGSGRRFQAPGRHRREVWA